MRPNRCRTGLVSLAFFCLFGLQAVAADPACPDAAVPLSALLMPPPKPDSAQTKAELQELQRLEDAGTLDHVIYVW